MEASTFIIGAIFILLLVYADKILSFPKKNEHEPKEKFPIKYPEHGTMFDNYEKLCTEIQECNSQHGLNICYVDIMIFEGTFPDSETFTHELLDLHNEKELSLHIRG